MSDSPQEENKPSATPKSKDASGEIRKTVSPENLAHIKANKKTNRQKNQLPLPIFILSILVVLGLLAFAAVAAMQWFNNRDTQESTSINETKQKSDAPVSILPAEPEGVTILEKQAEISEETPIIPLAPVAQGADIATGFAMDIGAADSFLELSRRFAETVLANGEENFQRLEPRAVLRETITGLEARLLIGPFKTEEAAKEACNVLVLAEGLVCVPAIFEGELITRQ